MKRINDSVQKCYFITFIYVQIGPWIFFLLSINISIPEIQKSLAAIGYWLLHKLKSRIIYSRAQSLCRDLENNLDWIKKPRRNFQSVHVIKSWINRRFRIAGWCNLVYDWILFYINIFPMSFLSCQSLVNVKYLYMLISLKRFHFD